MRDGRKLFRNRQLRLQWNYTTDRATLGRLPMVADPAACRGRDFSSARKRRVHQRDELHRRGQRGTQQHDNTPCRTLERNPLVSRGECLARRGALQLLVRHRVLDNGWLLRGGQHGPQRRNDDPDRAPYIATAPLTLIA